MLTLHRFILLLAAVIPVLGAPERTRAAEPAYDHSGQLSLGGRAGWYHGGGSEGMLRGVGAMARYQLNQHLAVEAGVSVFQPRDPGTCACALDIQTLPVDTNVLFFVFPASPFSLYGLAGATVELTDVEVRRDLQDEVPYDTHLYDRWGPQVGAGFEVAFGTRFAVTADARLIYFLSPDIPDPVGGALPDRETVHFTVGLSYFF